MDGYTYISQKMRVDDNGCWIYTGAMTGSGYGRSGRGPAHRVMWEHFHGPVPEGKICCHKCDVKLCVNPDHIFIGTHSDNMQDAVKKGRMKSNAANWRDRLPTAVVRLIRRSADNATMLAKKLGLSYYRVYNIRRGQGYAGIN